MPGRLQRTVTAALVVAAPALEVAPPKKAQSQGGLTKLYNEDVKTMQEMKRPLSIPESKGGKSLSKALNPIGARHEGMQIETQSGGKYLVHKEPGVGTVVTDAKNMGNTWKNFGDVQDVSGKGVTVGNLVKAGGSKFNTVTSNCQHAVKDMRRQADPTYRSGFETAMDDLSGIDRVEHLRYGGNCGHNSDSGPSPQVSIGRGGRVTVTIPIPCSIL
uniref:Uncharacterized protein n=1 Tax=Zooxanthella nutricula TaxID=1333877 RepID=A0A7S2M6Y0_9DINO